MKKLWLKLIVLVILAVVGVGLTSNLLFAKILEAAIGAPVKVGRVHLNLLSSEAGIFGLQIKNPQGFKEPRLASLPELFIRWDLGSIFKGRVHIKEVRLNLDEITVERNTEGRVNLMEIGAVKNAKGKSAEEEEAPSAPAKEGPRAAKPPAVQIDLVDLSLGRARYVDSSMGEGTIRQFPLEIRNAILRDVTDPRQITQQIVLKTLQRVGLNALVPDLRQLGVSWDAQASSATEEFKQALGGLKEKFKF